MPEFRCRVGTPGGDVREEVHVAADAESLRQDLAGRDLHVFDIRTRRPSLSLGGFALGGRAARVPRRQFITFNQEMVTLLRAGLPILQCLDVLLERMPEGAFQRYLRDIRDRVKSGSSLSEAFQAQGEAFPRIYAASLTAGEKSGELPGVMHRYLEFAQKTDRLRRRVTSALFYPALLVVVSIGLVLLLMFWILPEFSSFYLEFSADLPALTMLIVGLSTWLRDHWLPFFGGAAVGLVALRLWGGTEAGRRALDAAVLRLPVGGPIARAFNIAQLCRTLSTLLSGGIPLVTSLQVTAGAMSNRVFVDALGRVHDEVREGRSLWESLERTAVTNDLTVEMVKVGEATGALDDMLGSVAQFHDERVDEDMGRFVTLFEPILLIVMGAFVAVILLAMYLPIFRLAGAGT